MRLTEWMWRGLGMSVLAGCLLCGAAGRSLAMPPAEAPGEGHQAFMAGEHGHAGWAGLDLTTAQKELLRKDRIDRAKKMIQLRAEAETLRVDLKDAEDQESPELGKIEALAGKIGETHAKLIVERAKGRIYFQSILTPEQKKLLQEHPWNGGEFEREHERKPGAGRQFGMAQDPQIESVSEELPVTTF